MKKLKIVTVICTVCMGMSLWSHAQEAINVAGNTAHINGMTFEYSIGEMVLINTVKSNKLVVTQGLLQPNQQSNGPTISPSTISTNDLTKVYPNPTQNILFIELDELSEVSCEYKLLDATGKVVWTKQETIQQGLHKVVVDVQNYASGTYYLMLNKTYSNERIENYSYKIVKLN